MDEFDLPIMDRARARAAGEEDPPRSNPVAGPSRPFALRISNTTLAIVAGGLAVLLFVVWRGFPQPLAIAIDATPTAEAEAPIHPSTPAQPEPTLPPASGPGRIAAWWEPGGERTPGDLYVDGISGPIAACAAYPELVRVALRGLPESEAIWVRADDAGIGEELIAVLPDAGGVCAPPTATPAPVEVAPPAPVHVVATLEAPAVEVESRDRPTAEAMPTACAIVLTDCKPNLVEVRP